MTSDRERNELAEAIRSVDWQDGRAEAATADDIAEALLNLGYRQLQPATRGDLLADIVRFVSPPLERSTTSAYLDGMLSRYEIFHRPQEEIDHG